MGLATRENKEKQLPGFSFFYYYWFFVAMFFIYGRTLMPHFQVSTHTYTRRNVRRGVRV